ncbi:hypothetical protein K435DRAFT_870709 [Dendrothele bispora CBS 962.96]|uniref:Uncharacterized protein n=1 Tax=Dendrothele bispora (strain CBS 962.96) TaxID=1314807 RepID=A0A4S8L6E2_DENBC|nr:hypothetical protein K435DRAFT_870709 [Dendrothele bispora CBS 962.96]
MHTADFARWITLGPMWRETALRTQKDVSDSFLGALASSVRHATKFHHCQAIAAFTEHSNDFKAYANLTNFLYNNYVQVLKICGDYKNLLNDMKVLGISHEELFKEWLVEE